MQGRKPSEDRVTEVALSEWDSDDFGSESLHGLLQQLDLCRAVVRTRAAVGVKDGGRSVQAELDEALR